MLFYQTILTQPTQKQEQRTKTKMTPQPNPTETTEKLQQMGLYLLKVATDKIIRSKLPEQYKDGGYPFDWRWNADTHTPDLLQVFTTEDFSDVPFEYTPTDEEQTQLKRIGYLMRGQKPPKKFSDFFTPESIKRGAEEVSMLLEKEAGCCTDCDEMFPKWFADCRKWATGENDITHSLSMSYYKSDMSETQFDVNFRMFHMVVSKFLFMLSPYHGGDYKTFGEAFDKSGFNIVKITSETPVDFIGCVGIYTDEEKHALYNHLPNAKVMERNSGFSGYAMKVAVSELAENGKVAVLTDKFNNGNGEKKDETKPEKPMRICACGCGTTAKKMKKSLCCAARYVDEMHQKKDWAEHKKVCVNYKKKEVSKPKPVFQMPTTLEEEMAMWVCPPSCESCEFCEYKPQFCSVEID